MPSFPPSWGREARVAEPPDRRQTTFTSSADGPERPLGEDRRPRALVDLAAVAQPPRRPLAPLLERADDPLGPLAVDAVGDQVRMVPAVAQLLLHLLDRGLAARARAEHAGEPRQALEQLLAPAVEGAVHARGLAGGEHEHRAVVDVVHVVHEQVAVRAVIAGDVRERRLAVVLARLVGRVGAVVRALAARPVVTPDVEQVEPVADLVGGRATEVERV